MTKKLSDGTPIGSIHRQPRFFGLREVLKGISAKLRQDFASSRVIDHSGDAGEERELFLKNFLNSGHFPAKYAVSKGHGKVISSLGQTSLQTDLLLYDGFSCPVLRDGENHQFFPIESVYATIQVKSRLSKSELIDAAKNIASVKRLARYETVTREETYYSGGRFAVGDVRPIPFGAVFAYALDRNSLKSLEDNLAEYNATVDPNEWINLICVLNEGVIYNTFDLHRILDSRDLVKFSEQGKIYRPNALHCEEDALLDFYLGMIGALGMMDLLPPPLHEYVDLPIVSNSGHSFKIGGLLAAWKCSEHGPYEMRLTDSWVVRLANFIVTSPPMFEPGIYLAAEMGQSSPMKMSDGNDLAQWMPSAFIYTQDGHDPLPLLRMKIENGRPVRTYWELEIDGKPILLPGFFVKKDDPLFSACPKCPSGTPPVFHGGCE